MSIDLEYAIKADIRNNTVVREIDVRQRREMWRTVFLVVLTVGTFLLVAWQRTTIQTLGMQIESLKLEQVREREAYRQLRLNLATLQAPRLIESRARAMGMRPATLEETLVMERPDPAAQADGVLALAQ
jgi:hypothetical protein